MRLKKFDLKKYLAENKLLKEGNITITHNDVTGDSKSTVIDVSLIDNLINRLQPIVGNKTIEINNKMREDFIQTIVRRLTGYTDMGGGNVRINENKPLDEEYNPNQDPENKGSEAYNREVWKGQFGSMDGFDKAYPKKIPNNKNASIAKEIVRMIMDEQNESGEFDFDDAETYIVDILKKHGIK